jgi:hypothetical protein
LRGSKDFSLPKSEKVAFDVGTVGQLLPIPREWVIDWPYILRLKDKLPWKEVTSIKIKYLTKMADFEAQAKLAEKEMLGDLGKVLAKMG